MTELVARKFHGSSVDGQEKLPLNVALPSKTPFIKTCATVPLFVMATLYH